MSDLTGQAYLSTLVSAMSTRLLDPEQLGRLAPLSLQALSDHFGLGPLLDEQSSTAARSRAVEQSLIQLLLTELRVLIRPMTPEDRALLLDWGRKYALFNLKTLIRGKLHALDQEEIRENLFELPNDIRLADQELLRAENLLELLRQLEAGPHRQIARQAREVYEQQREPFAVEAAVDQRFYLGLVQRMLTLGGHHLGPLRRLLGAELDRTALLWLLRFRFSYQLSPSETYYWLVPSTRLLNRARLLHLVELDALDAVLRALPAPLDTRLAACTSITEVQHRIGGYWLSEVRSVLARSPSAVARALAYLMLREADLMQLLTLIQGRLLKLPDETIETALDLAEPQSGGTLYRAA